MDCSRPYGLERSPRIRQVGCSNSDGDRPKAVTAPLLNECAIWADEQKQRDLQKSREICINHK